MHKLVDPSLDALALVEGTLWIGPPDVVALNRVDAFCEVHPLVLGDGALLFLFQLTNQARSGGEVAEQQTEDLGKLLDCHQARLEGNENGELFGNSTGNKDSLNHVHGDLLDRREVGDEELRSPMHRRRVSVHENHVRTAAAAALTLQRPSEAASRAADRFVPWPWWKKERVDSQTMGDTDLLDTPWQQVACVRYLKPYNTNGSTPQPPVNGLSSTRWRVPDAHFSPRVLVAPRLSTPRRSSNDQKALCSIDRSIATTANRTLA